MTRADILSVHTLVSPRRRGLVDGGAIASMKSDAWLVNTSREPIVEEETLIGALRAHATGGYAVDVSGTEPLPPDHPFRSMPNVRATPHVGLVAEDRDRTFHGDSARDVGAWLRSLGRNGSAQASS